MPGLSKMAEDCSRPEATPEDEAGKIHNGMSVSLDDEANPGFDDNESRMTVETFLSTLDHG